MSVVEYDIDVGVVAVVGLIIAPNASKTVKDERR